jgi:hypothetical protein
MQVEARIQVEFEEDEVGDAGGFVRGLMAVIQEQEGVLAVTTIVDQDLALLLYPVASASPRLA